jgi:diguanylate cyclase (GGDEF)-like protein
LVAAGLLVLIRDRGPRGDRAALIDAAVITVVSALLAWILIIEPYARDPSLTVVQMIISVAYPLGDLVLLAVLVRLLVRGGQRSMALGFLSAGLLAALIGDVAFLKLQTTTAFEVPLIDLGWLCHYTFWGVAVLHPSANTISTPPPRGSHGLTRRRLLLLAGVALIAPGVLAIEWASGSVDTHVPEVVVATSAVFLLVLLRMGNMNREIELQVRLLRRQKVELRHQSDELRATLQERNTLAEKLRYQASHDSLTGLANRATFTETLGSALGSSANHMSRIAVLFLDVDDFKLINDRLGHVAGDELLVAVARRLRSALRNSDLAARLGGDEFGALLLGVSEEEARHLARRILQAIGRKFNVGGTLIEVHSSIGIAFATAPKATPDQLIREADTAMYLAKRGGKNRFEIFNGSGTSPIISEGSGTGVTPSRAQKAG